MDVIYIDEVFLLNLLADYLLLLSAARLRALPLRRWRFALGGVLGALYACLSLLPGAGWLGGALPAAAASVLMALVSYGYDPGFFRSWGAFTLLAAAYAGGVYACALLAGHPPGRTLWVNVSLRTLLLTFGLLYAALRLLLSRVLEKGQRRYLTARVTLQGRSVAFTALRDTGNTLIDPVTGLHVLIAERRVLSPLFPCPLSPETDPAACFRSLSSWPELQRHFRLVPYRAVGAEGLLLCFRPDTLLLDGREETLLVGLSPSDFCDTGEYSAIV